MTPAIDKFLRCALGFIIGAISLSILSGIQKVLSGYPIVFKGFYVPIIFGGTIGVILCQWRFLLKQKEQRIIKAMTKAKESDMLKSAFLKNLSHEIRTPLNAICGFSELINHSGIPNDKSLEYTNIIYTSSQQLLSIVSDVLTLSTLETNQEVVNLNKFCIDDLLIELYNENILQANRKSVSLKLMLPKEEAKNGIFADKQKLHKTINHLLSNALKFTFSGSIEFGYTYKGIELEFFVIDSGIGIKPSEQENIFNFFMQANDDIHINYGGTGIGLSICKGLVKLMGGKIWVESNGQQGATFRFTIPYQPAQIETKPRQPKKTNVNPTILIAEDEEYNQIYIMEILKPMKIDALYAKNGIEAIEICQQNKNICLVLMDIKMPKMDGYTAAKEIKKTHPTLPIIAQSAYLIGKQNQQYADTFTDYLPKPFSKEKLIEIIDIYTNHII